MRVAHLINSLDVGGAENMLVAAIPCLLRHCDEVAIVTLNSSHSPVMAEKVRDHTSRIHCLQSESKVSFRTLHSLNRLLRTLGVDLVHVHLFPSLYYGALLSPGLRRVAHEHSVSNRRRTVRALRPLEEEIYNRYDRVICVGMDCRDSLVQWIPSLAPKISIVANGIPLERFRSARAAHRSDYGIPSDSPLLMAVGRLVKEKDYETLIRAVKLLPDTYLCVVGDGPEAPALRSLVVSLELGNRVKFLGFRADVESLLPMSDLFVASSVYEGFGIAVAEAMAAGLPVVVTDAPGLREIVQHEKTGLLAPVSDPAGLAQAVSHVLQDNDLRQRLVRASLDKSVGFSIDRTVGQWLDIYKGILAK